MASTGGVDRSRQSLSSPASDGEYKSDEPGSQATQDIEKVPSQQHRHPNDPTLTEFGPPPDGGLEAWLVVGGCFCAVFASFGWINCALPLNITKEIT